MDSPRIEIGGGQRTPEERRGPAEDLVPVPPPQAPDGLGLSLGGFPKGEEASGQGEPVRSLRGGDDARALGADVVEPPVRVARLTAGRGGTRRRVRAHEAVDARRVRTPKERLLLLDTWMRSKLPATEFAALTGMSSHTLYDWKRRFEAQGAAGLCDGRRGGPTGSRLPEPTRRAILMMREAHPEWGQDRIADALHRFEGYSVSPGAVGRVLEEAGYVVEVPAAAPHEPLVRRIFHGRKRAVIRTPGAGAAVWMSPIG
jgi:transposase